MFTNSIDTKELITQSDGTKIRDLTQTMLEERNRNYVDYTLYKVPKEFAMRPDLISKAAYNNSMYAEIILKFNSISNPFTINEGDLILIPDLESAQTKIKDVGKGTSADPAQRLRDSYKYIDPLKMPNAADKKLLKDFNERQIASVGDGALPPNLAGEGESQVRYERGRVYFGEGAETCIDNGTPVGEFYKTIIENR